MKIKSILIAVVILTIESSFVFGGSFDSKDIKSWWLYESEDGTKPYAKMLNQEVTIQLQLDRLQNIEKIPNGFLQGKFTLVDLWATWCSPCLAAISENNEIFKKYKDKLNVIGICTSKNSEDFEQVVKSRGIVYPVGVDTSGEISKYFKVKLFPTYHLIDPAGKLVVADIKADYLLHVLGVALKD